MADNELEDKVYESICSAPGITVSQIVEKLGDCTEDEVKSCTETLLKSRLIDRGSPELYPVSFLNLFPKKLIKEMKK